MNKAIQFDPMEVQRHKIAFYSLPQEVDYSKIDELMQPVLRMINQSGWVWTAECCQGHPDATTASGWDHNTNPYLRLVVSDDDLGRLLDKLITACRTRVVEIHTVAKGPWVEVLVYVRAVNVLQRNQGIEALTKFADMCCDESLAAEPIKEITQIIQPNLLASRLRALAEKIIIDPRFRVSIGSGVTTELQLLFKAAADAVEELEELKCQKPLLLPGQRMNIPFSAAKLSAK